MAANSLKATIPSLPSTKVPREPILITENEGEKIFSALGAELSSLHAPLCDLAAKPPHPREASDRPARQDMSKTYGDVVLLVLGICICTVYALCTKAELVGWHHVLGICSHQLLQGNGQA